MTKTFPVTDAFGEQSFDIDTSGTADRVAVYLEIAAKLRATGEHGSEHASMLVEQLADLPAESPCEDVVAFSDGELDAHRWARFTDHLPCCKGCRAALVELAKS